MVVSPRAFLSLEATLARTLKAAWAASTEPVLEVLSDRAAAGDWAGAHGAINTLHPAPFDKATRTDLETTLLASILFGAQNLTQSPYTTSLVKRALPYPLELDLLLQQLYAGLSGHTAESVRRTAHQLVRGSEHPDTEIRKSETTSIVARVREVSTLAVTVQASLTASRAASFGFLSQAVVLMVPTYKVSEVLDGKTCRVCQLMHGKEFSSGLEFNRVMAALYTQDPEELKIQAPWPKANRETLEKLSAMGNRDLQMAGLGSPPYHPGCRGLLVRSDAQI